MAASPRKRLLILNCFSRNSLAVANSIGDRYELIGADVDHPGALPGFARRYLRSHRFQSVQIYPDPGTDDKEFAERIVELATSLDIDGILATGTTATDALSRNKSEIEDRTGASVAVEDYATLRQVTDKWYAAELAMKTGVPIPRTRLVDGTADFLEDVTTWTFPILLKPRSSYAAKGIEFFDTWAALRDALNANPDYYFPPGCTEPPFILQERIDGQLHDVVICAVEGEITASMTQERMVSLYDFGGGGIVNMTTKDPAAIDLVRDFIKEISWNGIVIFDFIRARDGRSYMLECNPKIWGTTELSTAAGANFVQQQVSIFVEKTTPKPVERYEDGLLYRYWVPECLYHWFHRPLSLGRLAERVKRTFRSYGAKRVDSNLHPKNIRHLLGIIVYNL